MPHNEETEESVEETLLLIDEIHREARRYRRPFEKKWKEYEKFYDGIQWPKGVLRPSHNLIFPIVEMETAILTDSVPGTEIVPRQATEADISKAKVMESAVKWIYDNQNISLKIPEVTKDSLKTGTGWLYVDYDPNLDNGDGNIVFKIIPWEQVYLDPAAVIIEEADYIQLRIPTRKKELQRRFPEFSDQIEEMQTNVDSGITSEDLIGLDDTIDQATDDIERKNRFNSKNMMILVETWVKDYSLVPIPEIDTIEEIAKESAEFTNGINPDISRFEDHETHLNDHRAFRVQSASAMLGLPVGEVATEEDILKLKEEDPKAAIMLSIIDDHIEMHEVKIETMDKSEDGKKPKYRDNLRLILSVESLILFDGEPDTQDGMYPLVPFYCYKDASSIYGTGEIQNIIEPQKSYNVALFAETANMRLMANNIWMVDLNSGIKLEDLTNEPGAAYYKNPGTEVTRIGPSVISPQFAASRADDAAKMNIISGIAESVQGRQPGGVTAARAIERLTQQALARIRLKSRYLELYSMRRLGLLTVSRVMKYWSTERVLRLNDENGKLQTINFNPDDFIDFNSDVRITPGTAAGIDKESILAAMTQLKAQGDIDAKTFFRITDLPFKHRILENIEESEQQQAIVQQLQEENLQLKLQQMPPEEQQRIARILEPEKKQAEVEKFFAEQEVVNA